MVLGFLRPAQTLRLHPGSLDHHRPTPRIRGVSAHIGDVPALQIDVLRKTKQDFSLIQLGLHNLVVGSRTQENLVANKVSILINHGVIRQPSCRRLEE